MNARKKWRFRFGLSGLLIGVAIAAITAAAYSAYREREVLRGLRMGTSSDVVLQKLGSPTGKIGSSDGWEAWSYSEGVTVPLDGGGVMVLNAGEDQQWTKAYSAQSMTVEFQDSKVIGASLHGTSSRIPRSTSQQSALRNP